MLSGGASAKDRSGEFVFSVCVSFSGINLLLASYFFLGMWELATGDREMSGAEDPEMWFLVWVVRPLLSVRCVCTLLSDCLV